MNWIHAIIAATIVVPVTALIYFIKKFVRLEYAEITPVKNLMVVQHFNTGHFAQLVDLSLLEQHGFAKLDQYFVDEPFLEEEMIEAGFKLRHTGIEGDDLQYWRIISDTELIQMHDSQGSYWLWGKEEEDG